MSKTRSGKTVKVSVSLDVDDLEALKRYAATAFDGNLSAAFAEAARVLRRREAGDRLIAMLGGPILTPEDAAAIEAEWQGEPRPARKKKSKRGRAA
jgi:hypothetical protein